MRLRRNLKRLMMVNKTEIKILSKDTINKIAAGEVIERPASVVKELVENSLDAGSKSIFIGIKKAGKWLIRVADDGAGMSPQDAELACKSHSTSKIESSEDLQHILTLGFRGEALASIAAVSQIRILTCTDSSEGATDLYLEGGELIDKKISGRSKGTTVEVRNLFYNTPARRKFYKTDTTEFYHIVDVVSHYILAFPEVEFKLIHGGRKIFHATVDMNLEHRIEEVLGEDVFSNLIKLNFCDNLFKLSGFVSKPAYTRKDRKQQMFFVNKRYVQNATLSHALYQAYHTLVERGRYPAAILFIEISPDQIDVNIHPTKLQIKFLSTNFVHDKFQYAVSETIQDLKSDKNIKESYDKSEKTLKSSSGYTESGSWENTVFDFKQKEGIFEGLKYDKYIKPEGDFGIYQIDNTYIINILPGKIKITDQHAAHERILYELFCKAWQGKEIEMQNLLLPYRIDLSKQESILLEKHLDLFKMLGFEIEEFGQDSFSIQSVPAVIKYRDIKKIFLDILDEIQDLKKDQKNIAEEIIKITACRSAIKAGDSLSKVEIRTLLKDLEKCKLPFTCPHGRPTQIEIDNKELEKRFRRK